MSNQNARPKRPRKRFNRLTVKTVLISALSFSLIIAALLVSSYASKTDSLRTAREELIASADEQAATLDAVWDGQVETLKIAAVNLEKDGFRDPQNEVANLQKLAEQTSFSAISFARADGTCYFASGKTTNISDREYFQKAMGGEWAVQRISDSRNGDSVVFVLAVPIISDSAVTGAILGSYSEKLLENLMIPEIYQGQAYSLICREDGTVSIGTDHPNRQMTSGNILTFFEDATFEKGESVEKIKADLATGTAGVVRYQIDGQGRYAAYVPLNLYSAAGDRLVMFNIVPEKLVDVPAERQSSLDALLIAVILTAFTLIFVTILVTQRKNAKLLSAERDKIRAMERQNRIAVEESGTNLARYDLKTKAFYSNCRLATVQGFGSVQNVPETFIDAGLIAPECVEEYRLFYEKLRAGESASANTYMKVPDGSFRWFRHDAVFVKNSEGKPYEAVITFRDVTEQREREAVYVDWQQTLKQRNPQSYTLFRCNLSKGPSFDQVEGGALLTVRFSHRLATFNERTMEYAGHFVHLEDFDVYVALLNSENLLADFYRGKTKATLEYRELVGDGQYRWLRVSTNMIQHVDSGDIEVFLMYEDIDAKKREEFAVKERTDIDPLTGVLNRTTFMEQFNLLLASKPESSHALFLIDLDGFKLVNDTFGHAVGDQTLSEIGQSLYSVVREGDLLGRLGGDEFMVALKEMSSQDAAKKKALQIQMLLRKTFSLDVQLSGSVGVVFYPTDGRTFETLYQHVDVALYAAKASGKDAVSFYQGDLLPARIVKGPASGEAETSAPTVKRRIFVLENDSEVTSQLSSMFKDGYQIDCCHDVKTAMVRLRRYGLSLSAILLSLDLPNEDGFAVLDRIHGSEVLNTVPIIVMSKVNERNLSLKAIQHGAYDYILKPIDMELIKIRVSAAIRREENDHLRAQNAYLRIENGERSKYRAVFENTGTVVVEYDWLQGQFTYDPAISKHIFGSYDSRPLWQILLSDMVADALDVKDMQELVHSLALDRNETTASMDVRLKTPGKAKHWFTMNAFKRKNDLNLTNRIILTFADINTEVLSDEKLRYQAQHDMLTGMYNRSAFLKAVERKVCKAPPGSYILLCCDINGFRFINERFGREEGDRLLQFSAERLMAYAEAVNGLSGRLSSDNFAVLLPNDYGMIEKTSAVIQNFFSEYPLSTKVTCRAGAYVISDPSMTVDSMLDDAETAVNYIKGKYDQKLAIFDESMNAQILLERDIAGRMEKALTEGEFSVFIQPQFNHATGRIVGAEALARWIDPRKGIVSPGVFIPVFEKNGFITRLDEFVWERSAYYLKRWIDSGNAPAPLSVNVSRGDIEDPNLCKKLLAIVQKYDLPISLFRLEITESLLSENSSQLVDVIEQLHKNGFLIEMDDFGSGYSSLNILKDVPVDVLKLDMKFLSEGNLGRGGMIISAVLRMARWLGIAVIAEGVETREQADFLLSIGCPTIQGFLYEKPISVTDFERRYLKGGTAQKVPESPVETKLDPNDFWNPLSSDSHLFNECIGPAVVFEYHDGKYEIMRMNRRFINAVQLSESVMLPACGLVHFCEEDQPKFKKAVLDAVSSGNDVRVDARCLLDNGSKRLFHVTLRVIARSSDRTLIFAVLNET